MKIITFLLNLDRRIIYLMVAVALLYPLVIEPLGILGKCVQRGTVKYTDAVGGLYDTIEALPAGSIVLISIDFDPSSKAELYPMAKACLRHAFNKNLKVLVMGLWDTGIGVAEELITTTAAECNKTYGKDYVFLGWRPGLLAVVTGMGQNIPKVYATDFYGKKVEQLEAMKGISSLKDIPLVLSITAGSAIDGLWLPYGADKYKFKLGGGCTGVIAPSLYPFFKSGQLVGFMGAMRGAAEYELRIKKEDTAFRSMDSLSLGHFLLAGLILLSNLFYILSKRATK